MTRDEDEIRSPQRGNRVDSINYYRNQLTDLNETVEYMQREKRTLVEEGNDRIRASVWISSVFDLASDVAANTLARSRKDNDDLIVGFGRKKGSSSLFKQIAFDFFFGIFAFLNRNIGESKERILSKNLRVIYLLLYSNTKFERHIDLN